MANFIVSCDLYAHRRSEKALDDLLGRLAAKRGRIQDNVWWVEYTGSAANLRDQLMTILRAEDRLFVAECAEAAWFNLLVDNGALSAAWKDAA